MHHVSNTRQKTKLFITEFNDVTFQPKVFQIFPLHHYLHICILHPQDTYIILTEKYSIQVFKKKGQWEGNSILAHQLFTKNVTFDCAATSTTYLRIYV